MSNQNSHWADIHADIILKKCNSKDTITCASGITPSGVIHIGNFREIISTECIVRALKEKNANVRFIYSWDDYDVFRKVPKYMPKQDMLQSFLRYPISSVPDPYDKEESYSRHNEVEIEKLLPLLGIYPEYIYQNKRYQASEYADLIRDALLKRDEIKAILNKSRQTPLDDDWFPISVFSGFDNKDNTKILAFDGDYSVTYKCLNTNKTQTVNLKQTSLVKLPWRIDWPARWSYEGVDFEPAGKDHHSDGGSFTSSKEICLLFGKDVPHTFQYDFVGLKQSVGKISSSGADVVSLKDVLNVYTPNLIRYMFLHIKPNQEFKISFDLDVITLYEEYDRRERVYYKNEPTTSKNEKYNRVYELSQSNGILPTQPVQIPFRHFCNLIQINSGDIQKAIDMFLTNENILIDKNETEIINLLTQRGECIVFWLSNYAPDDFLFSLCNKDSKADLNDFEKEIIVKNLDEGLFNSIDSKGIQALIQDLVDKKIKSKNLDDFVSFIYQSQEFDKIIKELSSLRESLKAKESDICLILENITKTYMGDEKNTSLKSKIIYDFIFDILNLQTPKKINYNSKLDESFDLIMHKITSKEIRNKNETYDEDANEIKKIAIKDKNFQNTIKFLIKNEIEIKNAFKNLDNFCHNIQDDELKQIIYDLSEQKSKDKNDKFVKKEDIELKLRAGVFVSIYKILINKTKGPKLANFILTIGADKVKEILGLY